MFYTFDPGNVRNVHQTVDTFIDTDKNAEIGNVLNFAFYGCAHRIFFTDDIPWIRNDLFHPQRNPSVVRPDIQNNRLDDLSYGYHL